MKWSYRGESFEVCDFTSFFRLHRRATATTPATVRDIYPFERWAYKVDDGDEVLIFAAEKSPPIGVIAPSSVVRTFRRWPERLTSAEA